MNVSADWWIFCPTDCTDYTDGGPQADEADEQGLINDGRLLITDFVHTENTEGNGGPQADGFVGKQQLSSIGQQLKEKIFFNCRYIAGNCCSRKRVGGLWSAIAINDQQLKEKNIYWWTQMEVRKRTGENKFWLMMKDSWLVMIDDWLLIVFTRKMRMMRMSASGRCGGMWIIGI